MEHVKVTTLNVTTTLIAYFWSGNYKVFDSGDEQFGRNEMKVSRRKLITH